MLALTMGVVSANAQSVDSTAVTNVSSMKYNSLKIW